MHRIRVHRVQFYRAVLKHTGPEQGTNENQPKLTECEEPPIIRFQVKWLEIIFPLAHTWKEGQKWAKANHHDLALSRSTPEQERSAQTVLAPLVFRTQLDIMSTSRNWQNEANWCEKKKSIPLLRKKLLNTSCLNLLISMDALLMKPAACPVLLRCFKHLVGNISVKFCTK